MKKQSLMKLMTVAMTVAVMVAMEGRSILIGIGEPKLPARFDH